MLLSLSACAGGEPQGETDSSTVGDTLGSDEKLEGETDSLTVGDTLGSDEKLEGESSDESSDGGSAENGTESKELDGETSETDEGRETATPSESDAEENVSDSEMPPEETSELVIDEFEVDSFKTTAEIEDRGGSADVTSSEGLKYSAAGYSSVRNGFFVVNDALTVKFGEDITEYAFNRITICYISSAPVKCTFTYTENGEKKTDSFFLEAGERVFSGLTENYIKGHMATGLESAVFEPLAGENSEFMLYLARPNQRAVYDGETYYLENERFRIGLRLVWGGGITYIEDKTCDVPKLNNLINVHDAGRLVQQSYYGTAGNDEYQPGIYNGSNWVYNPVQGGDQYWNHSRLIDIKVSQNSVYVKAQPQDWSLNGALTPSYMENTYTVYSDRIVVDNRFVDFSGWEHRFAHQELPAFYTVSYLDRFSYYNGLAPWTGGELISHDDLPFCGGEDKAQCYFKLLSSNTETWCAWTAPEEDYGIGLFTPGADMLLAARFENGKDKNPKANSCSYVAPVDTLMIKSFVPIEYSYMITTGSLSEIRSVFYENRNFAENASLSSELSRDIRLPDLAVSYTNINFATAEHNKYLSPMNSAEMKFNSDHNAIELIVSGEGSDPQINILYGNSKDKLNASNYGKIVIEYMIPRSNSQNAYSGELFLCTGSVVNAEGGKSVAVNYIADGGYHTVEIDLNSLSFWSGRINSIRFDFFNGGAVGDKIFIRSIKLTN